MRQRVTQRRMGIQPVRAIGHAGHEPAYVRTGSSTTAPNAVRSRFGASLADDGPRGRRFRSAGHGASGRPVSMAVESGCRRPSSPRTSVKRIARPFGPIVNRCAISPARPDCPPLPGRRLLSAAQSLSPEQVGEVVRGGFGTISAGGSARTSASSASRRPPPAGRPCAELADQHEPGRRDSRARTGRGRADQRGDLTARGGWCCRHGLQVAVHRGDRGRAFANRGSDPFNRSPAHVTSREHPGQAGL